MATLLYLWACDALSIFRVASPGHQNIFLRSWYILVALRCILKLLRWLSSKMVFLSSGTSDPQTLFRNFRIPFSSTLKYSSSPWSTDDRRITKATSNFWLYLISSRKPLVSINMPNPTLSAVTSHTKLKHLNCSSQSYSLSINAYMCKDFRLKASPMSHI